MQLKRNTDRAPVREDWQKATLHKHPSQRRLFFGACYAAHQVGGDIDTESGATYDEMSVAMAVDLVSDVKGSTSGLGYSGLALFCWLKVPDGMRVFWMVEQLFGSHWRHGWEWVFVQASKVVIL